MFKNKPFKFEFEFNKTILLSIYIDLDSDVNEELEEMCTEQIQNIGTDFYFLKEMLVTYTYISLGN